MAVEAELKRQNEAAALVPWTLVADPEAAGVADLADPVVEAGVRTRLDTLSTKLSTVIGALSDLLAELAQKVEPGNAVELGATTLAALESITVTGTQTDALTDVQLRAAAVPVSGPATDAQLRATPLPVDIADASVEVTDATARDLTHVVATVTAAGDTVVHAPAVGKKVRLHWVYALVDPDESATPLIKVSLGTAEKYRVFALSKRQVVTGPTDGALVVNLSAASNVAFTALIEEVA